MDLKIVLNFLIAIALGALVGIERQRGQKKGGFAGIRTFILIAFLGALSGFLLLEFNYPFMMPVIFSSVVSLIVVSYVISAKKGYLGITAEISAFITFFLGFIIMFDQYRNYALVFGVLITILLAFKDVLHRFAEGAKDVEWNDTLKFALVTLVIFPLLPKEINLGIFKEGPYYELNFLYPQEIWMLVIFVCAISFVGYFLVKIIGEKRGTNLIGAMGGLVSSTAVTQSMASHSNCKMRGEAVNYQPFVNAVLLATLVSFGRVGIISVGISNDLYPILVPVLILMVVGIFIFLAYSRKSQDVKTKINLKSPFKLKPALLLGFLYAILTFVSKLSFALKLGKSGVIIAAIVTGFFDIDPVILSVSSLAAGGNIAIKEAICAILLAVISNQMTKSAVALSTGSRKFGQTVAKILLFFVLIMLGWLFYMI
ncbi:MgtC/SapB family protein [Candidatus Dojkabacteria bacterium]|nr:MgtC/SapB family protein [Candidatus Dojkabacteria bacterium]